MRAPSTLGPAKPGSPGGPTTEAQVGQFQGSASQARLMAVRSASSQVLRP